MKHKKSKIVIPSKTPHFAKRTAEDIPVLPQEIYAEIRNILLEVRRKTVFENNFITAEAYWNIGQIIVEKQGYTERIPRGNKFLKELSRLLTENFGLGFTPTDIRYMQLFYLMFPIRTMLRPELGWTHYRTILSSKNTDAIHWYMHEAADKGWSGRQLKWKVSSLYYDHVKARHNRAPLCDTLPTLDSAPC